MNEVNTGNNSYTEWLLSTSSLLFNKRRMENWVSRHSCQQWNQWSQWSNLSLVSPRRASFNERKVSMWPPLDTHTRGTETSFLSVNESPFWFDYQLLSWKRDSFFNSWLSFPSSIMIQSSLRKYFSLDQRSPCCEPFWPTLCFLNYKVMWVCLSIKVISAAGDIFIFSSFSWTRDVLFSV